VGYEPDSLVAKSVFDYYHAQDCNSVEKSFKICEYKCLYINYLFNESFNI
jgi:hypothetical protein